MRVALLVIFTSFTLFYGCEDRGKNRSTLTTDLGPSNEAVSLRFQSYVAKSNHCSFMPDVDYRVILSGFAPFEHRDANFSSVVAMNFVEIQKDPLHVAVLPRLSARDFDGISKQGVVTIAGKRVGVCQLMLSVIWDLAGSIVLHEASLFKPDLVLMTGIDGSQPDQATIEQEAINQAAPHSGYEADGSLSPVKPVTNGDGIPQVIPGGPAKMRMTWDADSLFQHVTNVMREKYPNLSITTGSGENPGTYLCNNISYVVLYGLSGEPMPLAGGRLNLVYPGLSGAKSGFLHFPGSSSPARSQVDAWINIVAEIISAQMRE